MVNQDKLTNAIIEFVQRTMAFKDSDQEESINPGERHCDCSRYGCNCTGDRS